MRVKSVSTSNDSESQELIDHLVTSGKYILAAAARASLTCIIHLNEAGARFQFGSQCCRIEHDFPSFLDSIWYICSILRAYQSIMLPELPICQKNSPFRQIHQLKQQHVSWVANSWFYVVGEAEKVHGMIRRIMSSMNIVVFASVEEGVVLVRSMWIWRRREVLVEFLLISKRQRNICICPIWGIVVSNSHVSYSTSRIFITIRVTEAYDLSLLPLSSTILAIQNTTGSHCFFAHVETMSTCCGEILAMVVRLYDLKFEFTMSTSWSWSVIL